VSGSGIRWAISKYAPRLRQITMPAPRHSIFTGRMLFLLPNNTHTTIFYKHFTALWTLSRTNRVSRYQKKHSPTHIYCDYQSSHQSSLIHFLIFYYPWHPPCSIYMPDQFFPQSLSIIHRNWKYITYCNAERGGPSHGHR